MLKIKKKIKFTHSENRMKQEGNVKLSINSFDKNQNKNLFALLRERFNWMNKFIQKDDKGIEVGAAAGFSKLFINNDNFKISDYSNYSHLDYKNIDAQNTGFPDGEFNYDVNGLIASKGSPDLACINKWLKEDFFQSSPPKSTGREAFGIKDFERRLEEISPISDVDLIVSLVKWLIKISELLYLYLTL